MIRSTTTSPLLFLTDTALKRRPQLLLLAALSLSACSEKAEPVEDIKPLDLSSPEETNEHKTPPSQEDEAPAEPPPTEEGTENPPDEEESTRKPFPEHTGPWFWILRSSAAVYEAPKASRTAKVGYIKRGGRIGILEGTIEGEDCPKGWYKVATGGYICSHVGTTDENHKDVKFRPSQPNLDEILPYKYARNSKNGTPLYRSIPSKQQSYKYEPYLPGAIAEKEKLEKERAKDEAQMRDAGLTVGNDKPKASQDKSETEAETKTPTTEDDDAAKKEPTKVAAKSDKTPASDADPAAKPETPDEPEEEVPLWEREEDLHEVTLEDLRKEKDEILETRMMKGFYVAIDKTFNWDGRTWYKTTKGLVTPSANFWQTEGADFKGVEIDGENIQLPVGWVFGGREKSTTYEIDEEKSQATPKGTKKKFELIELKYSYHQIGKSDYFQMKDGQWIRDSQIRMTTPGKRPDEVGPNERWIDVDISEQTLVVFEGDRPVYATLISSGKESRIKDKDHSTPRGMWRVREKHVVATMDGDGSAAGDLPYSIEDVPYIMYFHKSYATHGAFWHRNYGVQMSHGCINLAPLDAKWVFFYADPQLPPGFHGNWSSDANKGSMVVVHD